MRNEEEELINKNLHIMFAPIANIIEVTALDLKLRAESGPQKGGEHIMNEKNKA